MVARRILGRRASNPAVLATSANALTAPHDITGDSIFVRLAARMQIAERPSTLLAQRSRTTMTTRVFCCPSGGRYMYRVGDCGLVHAAFVIWSDRVGQRPSVVSDWQRQPWRAVASKKNTREAMRASSGIRYARGASTEAGWRRPALKLVLVIG